MLLRLCCICALLAACFALGSAPEPQAALELWYWHHSDVSNDAGLRAAKLLIDRAAAAGYTGAAFWEYGFGFMTDPAWPRENVLRLREMLAYASDKGLNVMALGAPFGWSGAALRRNGNLAEAQRVIGAQFRVDLGAHQIHFIDSFPGIANGGFEAGRSDWFSTNDPGIGVGHVGHAGNSSAVIVDPPGHARFRQRIQLTPWRQYHLSLWIKSSNFTGTPMIEVLDSPGGATRFLAQVDLRGSHGWTHLDYMFNSRDTTTAWLYFGVWGACSGIVWFDDVELHETALVYVARRDGAPLRMYSATDPNLSYREGADFDPIRDERLGPPRAAFRDVYHAPPVVTLPRSTKLRQNQVVALDFYSVFPLPLDNQVGMCLTEPGVFQWLEQNARDLKAILPPRSDLLLSYDEMRQMNSCASCRAKNMTAGELLAWNARKTVGLYQRALPGVTLYAWNDMFDPYHNAVKNYFYVEGDLAGSWKGLPPEVGILNWNHAKFDQSLAWFAGSEWRQPVPHPQILAGYYDSGDPDSARKDLLRARGTPGVRGIMYVTWRDDYSQLEKFAIAARQAWSPTAMSSRPK